MVSPNQLIFQEHCREVNYFIADLDEQISSLPTSTPQGPVGSGAHFNTLDSQPGNLSWTQLHGALQVTWPTGRISPADINAGPQGVSVVARLFERVGAAEVVELGCEGKNEVIGWLRELRKQVGERANEERRASHGGGKSASVPPKISSPELGEVSVRQKNVAPHSQPKLFRESPSPPLSPSSLSTASNSDSTHHRRSLSSDIASFRPLERRCTTQSSTNARTTPRETSQQQKTNLAKDDYRVDDLVLATHEGNWWPAIIGDERNLPEHIIGRRYPTSLPVLSIPNRDPTWRLASRIRPCAAHETIPTSLASADREAFQEALEIVNDHSQVEKWAEDSKKEWCGCGRGSNVGGWIECEGGRECERLWFHKLCVGVEEQEEPDFWMCEDCRKRATMAEKGKGKGKGRKKA